MEDSDRLPRKLAAILYADVAGYSRLTGEDEDRTHRVLSEYLDLISSTVKRHRGRVMHYAGDAVLAMFDAVVDAMSCAARIQGELEKRNEGLPDEQKVQFRIGVNMGDVIEDRGDIYGDGVNVAARLESLAETGGICISESVRTATGDKLPLRYEFIGEQSVKNISRPVRAYHARLEPGAALPSPVAAPKPRPTRYYLTAALAGLLVAAGLLAWFKPWQPGEAPTAGEYSASPLLDKPSIAVLPLDNLSGDKEQEYFADGMTDDLITDLSRISGLMVIARNSSFTYKGRAVNVQDVGRELGVHYVLEGSVRRVGDRVRINAQLIDVKSGMHLWADRYDRNFEDILNLQDEVIGTIVQALAVKLTPAEADSLARKRTVNSDAYDLLLRGNEHRNRFTPEDNAIAREFYTQAIELDPDFARAYANYANTLALDVEFLWTDDIEGAIREGLEFAGIAHELDDSLPQIHFTRGGLFLILRRHEAAVAASRRSIEVDPSYADGYGMLAHCLVYSGEPESALRAIADARRLNPRLSFIYLWVEGHALFLMGRDEEALVSLRDMVERNPGFERGRLLLAAVLGQLGMNEDADWEAEEILALRPDFSIATEKEQALYKRSQDFDRYFEGLRKAGLPD